MKFERFPRLAITPLKHQSEVAKKAYERSSKQGIGTFNVGEIGTGKTLVAMLWALAHTYNNDDAILWITPSFLKVDVEEKIKEYFHDDIPTITTFGKDKELPSRLMAKADFPFGYRLNGGATLDNYKIVITNYELLNLKYKAPGRSTKINYWEAIAKYFNFKYIVIDESHRIKSWDTGNYNNVFKIINYMEKEKELKCTMMPMTGTPVGNGLHDLYAPMSLLNLPDMPTLKDFKDGFCIKNQYGSVTHVRKAKEREWKDFVSRNSIIVRKKDVLVDLKDKIKNFRFFRLSDKIHKLYEKYAETQILAMENEKIVERNKLTLMLHLQAFVSGFAVKSTPMEDGSSESEFIFIHDEKIKFCVDLIENYLDQSPKMKIIVWSRFKATEKLLSEYLDKKKIKNMCLESSKKGEMIRDFRTNDDSVVIINLGCNEGFTITESSTTIYLEESYSHLQKEQSGGRNHRHGQLEQVEENTIIAKNTIDEIIRAAVEVKNDMSEGFMTHESESIAINSIFEALVK